MTSKPILGKILGNNESPTPRTVLISDSADVCGRGVIYALLKSHLLAGSDVFYLATALSPNKIKAFIEDEGFSGKVKYYDGYSDPCGWENRDSCVLLSESLYQIFGGDDTVRSKKSVLVIDKLDDLINHQDSLNLIRNLHKLSSGENVEQLVVYCGRDCVPGDMISAISHIASATIHIEPRSPCRCKVLLRKPSGKIVQTCEEFTLTPDLQLQGNRIVEKDSAPQAESSDADAILAAQTTFNLSLTEDQRKSKNMLLLPHTRVQSSGGQIHYTPDDADDWDDEDPDDDLDI